MGFQFYLLGSISFWPHFMLIRLASINASPLPFAVHSQFISAKFSSYINKMTEVI